MPETVAPPTVPGEPAPASRRLRTVVLIWSVVGILLATALMVAIGEAGRQFYSASGLVQAYLTALAAHQPAAALALPGVDARQPAPDISRELLRGSVLGELTGIRLTESDAGDGTRHVTANYVLDSVPGTSVFTVEQTAAWLGVFPSWRFAVNPLAVVTVTIEHAHTFTLAGLNVDPRAAVSPSQARSAGYGAQARYLMFAPARYAFGHASTLLAADPVSASITPGSNNARVVIDAQAGTRFTDAVQKEIDQALTACATQHVLQPAGCPFGTEIDDRVEGTPRWTIVRYPTVRIVPGETGWQTRPLTGIAQIQASVRSLFDGTIAAMRRDVPFTMNVGITIGAGDAIAINAR